MSDTTEAPPSTETAGKQPEKRQAKRRAARLTTTSQMRSRIQSSVRAAKEGESRALDPFADQYGGADQILPPPYSMSDLASVGESSDSIYKCASAMATNVGGHGYTFIQAEDVEFPDEDDDPAWEEIEAERKRLKTFFKYCCTEMSFQKLRYITRMALEFTGNAFWEVLRDGKGEIQGFSYLPVNTMRLRKRARRHVEMDFWQREANDGSWTKVKRMHKPRSFVQIVDTGTKKVYFKEFGDPRHLNYQTGLYEGEANVSDVPLEQRATEVIHFKIHVSDRTPYGLPRWLSAADYAFARAEAAQKNADTISTNGLPSAIMMLFGAEDVDDEVERIQEQFALASSGEAVPELMILPIAPAGAVDPMDGGKGAGTPKGEIVKLNDLQQQDALFMNYSDNCDANVAGAFRMPPLFIGRTTEYTRATSESSKRTGQEQTFAPEANEEDFLYNERILPDLGARYWQFQTLMSPTSDESVVGAVVQALAAAGGITPRMAAEIATKYLGLKHQADDAPWVNLPSEFVKQWITQGWIGPPDDLLEALGIVQAAMPNEPASQPEEAPADDEANEETQAQRRKRIRQVRAALRLPATRAGAQRAAAQTEEIITALLDARRRLDSELGEVDA